MKKTITLLLCTFATSGLMAQGNTSWMAAGIDPAQMRDVPSQSSILRSADMDYSQGTFIVNEDWYGHQNSTVNFLTHDGEWHYRVFQTENPGHELGCTTQFGTIYGDKFYLVSKQERDPGAKITGSRFAVCDAKTMKVIKEFKYIAQNTKGKSIADGRSYLPVDEHKGYIGTSNGIWIYDSDKMTIDKQVEGSGNPNADGYGELYYAQIGTMVRANDLVFAVHQQYGLLIIDPKTDKVIRTIAAPIEKETVKGQEKDIQRGFGSIVQSKDGTLWISMTQNTAGDGSALEYMLNLNPYTFQVDTVKIPLSETIGVVPNSWYAWTADGFCASAKENKIYWNGQPKKGSWFTGYQICGYDIDKKQFFQLIDLTQLEEGNWRLYGTGFRLNPQTDELYTLLYHEFQDPTHLLARISNKGEVIQEYSMIVNYWFPALPVFPDNAAPVVSSSFPSSISLTEDKPVYKLALGNMVSDADNMDAAIVKSISSVTPSSPISAIIRNDSLIVSSTATTPEDHRSTVTIRFNSNGKIITKDLLVTTGNPPTSVEELARPTLHLYPNPAVNTIRISIGTAATVEIYTTNGTRVQKAAIQPGESIDVSHLSQGLYFVRVITGEKTETVRMIKR
ncbi:MAG: DUF5074 domain-containing protein [Parabacteroides sp.]|nr:DUF5074 domain-containing protein [Parabacteroides sp.]